MNDTGEDQAERAERTAEEQSHAGEPRVCFVIGRPRSGTTVFNGLLQTHPQLFCMNEVFNESNKNTYFTFLRDRVAQDADNLLPSRSVANFLAYLSHCKSLACAKKPTCEMVAIDVKYDQAHLLCEPWWQLPQLPRLFYLMREEGWHVIDIHRDDLVSLTVSNLVAIQTKVYHSRDLAGGEQQHAKIRVKPRQFLNQLAVAAKSYRMVSRHFDGYDKYLRVRYEEMFDPAKDGQFSADLCEQLGRFLGIENRFNPVPRLRKLLVEDIFSYIENADEIRQLLEQEGREYVRGSA